MSTSTRQISKSLLDKETDARFWAQTGYKIGHKLDPKDLTDKAMVKVWLDIYAKVKREDDAGKLVVTYNHPAVEKHLDDAAQANQTVDAHLDHAVTTPSEVESQQHVEAAAVASRSAANSAAAAAVLQPPTVSPIVVTAAAQEAAHAADLPPPSPVVQRLPSDHPAVTSVQAQPVLPPEVVTQAPNQGSAQADSSHADPASAAAANAAMLDPATPRRHGAKPRNHREHLAVAQAKAAPAVAVAVHEAAQDAPPATGTLHPQTVAQIRGVAQQLALATTGNFVGVSYSSTEQWSVPKFASHDEAAAWYGTEADHADQYRYLAYFDKSDATWPSAVDEVLGASGSGIVREHVDLIQVITKTKYGPIAAVGVFLGLTAAVIAVNAKHRRRTV